MHVFAHLRAAAHGGPGVHHRAFVHVGANVHVRGHEHRALADEAAAPRHGGRRHAHAAGGQRGVVHAAEFGGHLVKKGQFARTHGRVVSQAEGKQHGFLDPLMHRPLPHAFSRGHAQAPRVQLGQHMPHGLAHVGRGLRGGNLRAVFPRGINGLLQ